MNNKFKIFFLPIWIVTSVIIALNIAYTGLVDRWITTLLGYLYVASLISIFIDSSFLNEKTTHSEKLIEAKNYDLLGILFLVAFTTGILFYIGLKSNVNLIMAICTFLLSIWILLKFRKQISKRYIVNGLIFGGICAVAMYKYIPALVAVLVLIPFTYVSGSILNEKFPVTTIQINKHSLLPALKSFSIGCLFAIPMGFSNLLDIVSSSGFKWINQYWQTILALVAGIMEETWVRLFIITFIFAFVSSKTNKKYLAVLTALIISSAIFGFSHSNYLDTQNCIKISILYGLPLGILFIKRDFETAIGYHFMIDFIGAMGKLMINNG